MPPRKDGMQFLGSGLPRKERTGRVIVHNHILHNVDTKPDVNGFRAWTLPEIELTGGSGEWVGRLVLCECGWAGLTHYRVKQVKRT